MVWGGGNGKGNFPGELKGLPFFSPGEGPSKFCVKNGLQFLYRDYPWGEASKFVFLDFSAPPPQINQWSIPKCYKILLSHQYCVNRTQIGIRVFQIRIHIQKKSVGFGFQVPGFRSGFEMSRCTHRCFKLQFTTSFKLWSKVKVNNPFMVLSPRFISLIKSGSGKPCNFWHVEPREFMYGSIERSWYGDNCKLFGFEKFPNRCHGDWKNSPILHRKYI